MNENIDAINKDLQVNELVKNTIEIKYKPAVFFNRIMANLLDFLIFALIFLALFIGCRKIIISTDSYNNAYNAYRSEQLASGLYFDDGSKSYPDIVSYVDDSGDYTHQGKHNKSKAAITTFYSYAYAEFDSEVLIKVQKIYQDYLLSDSLVSKENNKYILSISFNNEQLVIEENSGIYEIEFYNNVYKPFIKNKLLQTFASYSENYRTNITHVSNLFIFVGIPISFFIAGILTYFVPPLFFKRGRMTLGKALCRIGLVDSRYLNLSFPRFLARFSIFFFAELTLSIFSFAIPIIISFSMMAFSNKKQGFPDYMLSCREVDTKSNNIYYSLEEIKLRNVDPTKKAVDFKQIERL